MKYNNLNIGLELPQNTEFHKSLKINFISDYPNLYSEI